jgi:hypothetical protein
MANIVPQPNVLHINLFKFLQISPSYFAAHRFKKGSLTKKEFEKIPGYKDILVMYEFIGDIFEPGFDEWWYFGGYKLFDHKMENQFIFKCDLNKSLDQNIAILKLKYTEKQKLNQSSNKKFEFLKSKMQEKVVAKRYDLIYAITPGYDPKYKTGFKDPLWFTAYDRVYTDSYFAGIKKRASAFRDIKSAIEYQIGTLKYRQKKYSNKEKKYIEESVSRPFLHIVGYKEKGLKQKAQKAKRYISMLVSKEKKEAFYIAENAARGIFPSRDPCKTSFNDFQYLDFQKNISLSKIIMKEDDFKGKTGYSFSDLGKPISSSSKIKSNVAQYVDRELSHRLLEEVNRDLKPLIEERSDAIARKKYQLLKQIGKKSSKPAPQRSGSSKG